jgi:hypothetical protein
MLCSSSEQHIINEKQDFFIFSTQFIMVIQEFVSASYFVGSFVTLLKQHGLLYLPSTIGGSVHCH